jgi:hypothetical protein
MRTTTALTLLAVLAAVLPVATASSQSDATGTLHVVNLDGSRADVWAGDTKIVANLGVGEAADEVLEAGTHTLRLCAAGSTGPGPGPECIAMGSAKKLSLESGQNRTVAFTPSWTVATNDQAPTAPGKARYTLHNPGQVPTQMSVCIDGDLVAQADAFQSDDAEVDAGDDQAVDYFLLEPGVFQSCAEGSPFASTALDLAAGTNLVDTYAPFTTPACTEACVRVLPVGEDPAAPTEPSPSDVCTVVAQLQSIQFALEELFVGVEAGRASTYPDAGRIEGVTASIRALLDAGDATVPADVRDAYLGETALARDALAVLAAADDDLEEIPEQELRDLVERIEQPAPPTRASSARQAALSEWLAASCTLDTPEIAFTG